MKKWLVYKHINKINGKIYIGITCRSAEQRWGKTGKTYKNCPRFFSAIKKYGWNNFEHKIIMHGLFDYQAKKWEEKLIKYYKSNISEFGYNLTSGGDGSEHNKETIEIIRQSKLGEKNPNFGKYKELNSFYGKKHSLKSRRSMSKNNWSKKHTKGNSPNAKKIYSLLDNKIFTSMKECCESCNICKTTLYKHCNNKTKQGRKFMYYEDFLKGVNK